MELVIPSHLLYNLSAVNLKDYEVSYQVKESPPLKDSLNHNLKLRQTF